MAGPERRETFYEAQRRHRRAGWRFSVLSGVAVLLLGLPVSVLISPFIAAAGLIALDVANQVTPTPDPVDDLVELIDDGTTTTTATTTTTVLGLPGADPATTTPATATTTTTTTPTDSAVDDEPGDPATLAAVAVGLVVPGMVVMGLTFLGVRRLFLRSGAGAVGLAAGARPPRPDDVEERQLVNLVEEMALAAGVPPPRVLVVDSGDANAAVAGRSIHDATIVVPRGLLSDLGRQPTGGIVASMLAVVVNGDLRVALVIASAFQTLDVVGAVLAAPFSRRTRRALWRVARLSLRPRRRGTDPGETDFLARELSHVAQLGGLDDDEAQGCLASTLGFPFFVASVAYTLTRLLFGGLVVAPIMAALWRRRRLLADATAVELTRDPDGLARALEHLQSVEAAVPPGPWTHLFAVGPEATHERTMRAYERRRDEIWADGQRAGESAPAALGRRAREAMAASGEMRALDDAARSRAAAGTAGDAVGEGSPGGLAGDELASFLPTLGKRLDRLEEMGAQPRRHPAGAEAPARRASPVLVVLAWVIGIPLLVIIAVLVLALLACVAALIYLALVFELVLLMPLVLVLHLLLR